MNRRKGKFLGALVVAQLMITPVAAQVAADGRNLPPPSYGNTGGDVFAATLRCASYNFDLRSCRADTQNRVVLLEREAGRCNEGRDWGYDANRIWVDNQCIATFGYGYAPINRPQPTAGNWDSRNFAGTLQCESRGRQQERCYVATDNRVELLEQRGRGQCIAGTTWGYTRDFIWVDERCSAFFGYGNRVVSRPPAPGSGANAGAVIGGVAVAAGLIALLSSGGKGATEQSAPVTPGGGTRFPPRGPAAVSADLARLPSTARPAVQNCLFEAARQVGATGGSALRFINAVSLTPTGDRWRLSAAASATYPDGERPTPFSCTADSNEIVSLAFAR